MKWNNSIYNKYKNNSKHYADWVILQLAISDVSELVVDAKNSCNKLANKFVIIRKSPW